MDRYAVVGNPIAHSRSPRIHALFAAELGHRLSYSALLAPRAGFARTVANFLRRGGCGVNVTVPFKLDALRFVDELADTARFAGAVNTIVLDADRRSTGHNTDGIGLVRDITVNLGCGLTGARVLILGAGGAVRGILLPLVDGGAAEVHIRNRTPATAEQLVKEFDCPQVRLFEESRLPFDVVINGTSAGLSGAIADVASGLVDERTFGYDLSYGRAAEPFLTWLRESGAGVAHDGLGMLVEQAAAAYELWRGERPSTRSVIARLRNEQTA